MKVSFIIINYNTKYLTEKCLKNILNNKSLATVNYEIIIVDNCSFDGSKEYFELISESNENILYIYNNKNYGFGKANNIGVDKATGDVIILCNSDVYIKQSNIKELLNVFINNKNIGVLGCKILNKDGSLQTLGRNYPTVKNQVKTSLMFGDTKPFMKLVSKYYRDKGLVKADWISGCFMIISKNDYMRLRGFDESIFMYHEDIDFCFRMEKILGKKNYVYDKISITHEHGGSSNSKNKFVKFDKIYKNNKNLYYVIKKNKITSFLFPIKAMRLYYSFVLWLFLNIKVLLKRSRGVQ